MRPTQAHPVSVPLSSKLSMEDRKRSLAALDVDDAVPPSKRQATVNGTSARMEPEKEKEIEMYQKEAILRQMREYKRERNLLEAQVSDMAKRSAYHDDHLRTLDAWFTQLLDEIRLMVVDSVPSAGIDSEAGLFHSALLPEDNITFQKHLHDRTGKIRNAITDIFGRLPGAAPEVRELQERLSTLLASEKAHVVESQRIKSERDQLSERLENAASRYLLAEKKLDRAKSSTVQKLHLQSIMGGNGEPASATSDKASADKSERSPEVNGGLDSSGLAAADAARKEAVAAAEQRKLQLEQLEAENKRITDELSAAQFKAASLTDDDYAKTSLCKLLKSQHEHVIKRVNDLEATNVQLREEAKKLHAERTAYRDQVDDEARAATGEVEGQLARAETDLARIRNARDEMNAELSVLKGAQEQQVQSTGVARELATLRDERISDLESQVERLRLQLGENRAASTSILANDLSSDELKSKVDKLEKDYAQLNNELASMEATLKKSQALALAAKKLAETAGWEEQLMKLGADKAKALEKFYAAMKAKEAREVEVRMLKLQSAKWPEIVTKLTSEYDTAKQQLPGLEKQIAESKESWQVVSQQNRTLQQKISESSIVSESLKTEIVELKKLVSAKDTSAFAAASSRRQAEVDLEELKVRLEDSKKSVESLKKKGAGKDTADSDDWRKVAICPVCNQNLRNTVLKLCSHVFCNHCVQNLISNRSRKCPSCGKAFGTNDSMPIILT